MSNTLATTFALSAAALFMGSCQKDASPTSSPDAAAPSATASAKVKCMGVNECRGKGACDTTEHSCAGQNACAAKGWVFIAQSDCDAKGGTVCTESPCVIPAATGGEAPEPEGGEAEAPEGGESPDA